MLPLGHLLSSGMSGRGDDQPQVNPPLRDCCKEGLGLLSKIERNNLPLLRGERMPCHVVHKEANISSEEFISLSLFKDQCKNGIGLLLYKEGN